MEQEINSAGPRCIRQDKESGEEAVDKATKPSRESTCSLLYMLGRCVVSRNFIRCSLCNYQHGGRATNKQDSIQSWHQFSFMRGRLAAIEAIIKSERGTIIYSTRSMFVCCVRSVAASERGCSKNPPPHAEHRTERAAEVDMGYIYIRREKQGTIRGGNFFTCANVVSVCFAWHTTHDSLPF